MELYKIALNGVFAQSGFAGLSSGNLVMLLVSFVLLYLAEGLMRATSDHGLSQQLAIGEIVLCGTLFLSVISYIRATRPPKEKAA